MIEIKLDLEAKRETEKEEKFTIEGYQCNRGPIRGYSLFLQRKSGGKELILRLKENIEQRIDEIQFWSMMVVKMIKTRFKNDIFDIVSNPPPSIPRKFHLATMMAELIAKEIDAQYLTLFLNKAQRGRKAWMGLKLEEQKKFEYILIPQGRKILLFDDMICTGNTAIYCTDACSGENISWAFLCQS